jgi:excisionase family DNA binding protein/YgiT-type zinc finger domain-containing protein
MEVILMQCASCGGALAETTIDFTTTWKGHSVIFQGMPALRCEDCGNLLLTPDAADLMSDFIDERLARSEALPPVLTVEEAAAYLRVSTQTVYNLQRAGQLPGSKIGGQLRFLRKALDEMLSPRPSTPRVSEGAAKGERAYSPNVNRFADTGTKDPL